MSEGADDIVVDTARRIFRDLCEPATINDAEAGKWPAALWQALEEAGLPLTWVAEEMGGAGASLSDGFAVLRVAGRVAAPVPLAETLLAGRLLSAAGIAAPAGPLTLAPVLGPSRIALTPDGRLGGRARRVPFAREARHIAVLAQRQGEPVVALAAREELMLREGKSLAGEPADDIDFDGAVPLAAAASPIDDDGLKAWGAAARMQQMAGALERILEQSVEWALQREQFGRPIGKFQAVQHNLAILAGEVAAASAAADAATEAFAGSEIDMAAVAIGKVRVGEAAGIGAAIAHQAHGAIGFTYEHSLHHSTRRLWAWREEFGNEAYWSGRLGRMVAELGADELWHFITAGS